MLDEQSDQGFGLYSCCDCWNQKGECKCEGEGKWHRLFKPVCIRKLCGQVPAMEGEDAGQICSCTRTVPVHLGFNEDLAENIMDCFSCKCCEYICSSKIPLVSTIGYGKSLVAPLLKKK